MFLLLMLQNFLDKCVSKCVDVGIITEQKYEPSQTLI